MNFWMGLNVAFTTRLLDVLVLIGGVHLYIYIYTDLFISSSIDYMISVRMYSCWYRRIYTSEVFHIRIHIN